MKKITIVDKIIYSILSFVFSLLLTIYVISPILFKTIGGITYCGFPDGGGSCISQLLTLISLPIIFVILTIFVYKKIMSLKRKFK